MKRYFAIILGLVCLGAGAQQEDLILRGLIEEGTVRALKSQKTSDSFYPLESAEIKVFKDGVELTRVYSDSAGFYKLALDAKGTYRIFISKSGYLPKIIAIDGSHLGESSDKAVVLDADVALFRDLGHDGLREYTLLPAAKCRYFKNRKEFRWDPMYAHSARAHLYDLLEEATIAWLGEEK
jgi:hypothetical protein